MSAFTPGPWEHFGGTGYINAAGIPVADVWPKNDPDQLRANAHLIAAAPDLYEALDDAMKVLSALTFNGVPATDAIPGGYAALAKARGES